MKSYLEITWTLTACLWYVCFHLTSKLFDLKFEKGKAALICAAAAVLAERLCVVLWLFFPVIYGIACFSLFPGKLLVLCESLFLYFGLTCLFCMMDSVQMQLFFLYARHDSAAAFVILAILALLDGILSNWYFSLSSKAELYVPVKIETPYQSFECIGFLDTGNHAEHLGLPVVFVRDSIVCECLIEVKGIGNAAVLHAVQAHLDTGKKKWQAFVACAEDLQVECLLHCSMK